MTELRGTRIYGLVILGALLVTALYTVHERRTSIYYPGWFYRFSPTVWCHTSITIRPRNSLPQIAHFWHYPGKSVERLVNTYVGHSRLRETMLNERVAEYATTCYPTWQAAASEHPMFQAAVKDYGAKLDGWSEADYKGALLYAVFGKGEDDKPAIDTYLLRRAKETSAPVTAPTPTPDRREPLKTSGVLCQSEVTHPDLRRAVRFVHPPGDRDLVSRFIRDEFDGGAILEDYSFARSVCWQDWKTAYEMMRISDRIYAKTFLPEGVMTDEAGSRMRTEEEYRHSVLEAYFLDERPHIEATYFTK